MPLDKLLKTIKASNSEADLDLVRLAYDFAEEAHRGQKRLSGEDYIEHSLATAQTLAEMNLDLPIIIAGLLHDVPEETKSTLEDIKHNFGKDVASMVEGITKLGTLKYRGIERYLENIRKMFIAMAKDLRVILIKFADRLHNLETLDVLPPQKRFRIALETLEIYAPIANRLGIGELRGRLEDLAFKHLMPQEYDWLKGLMAETIPQKEKCLEKIKKIIQKEIAQAGIEIILISGRTKHLYSLYRKLSKYNNDLSRIYDLVALRIVVKDISGCYGVLGIVHKRWKPLKGRIKDYIAQPKPNGYRSLHTTVFGEGGEIVEFQIRTKEMHEEAEYGIAAHWTYTDQKGTLDYIKGKIIKPSKKELAWIDQLTKWRKEIEENKKYLESLKIDVFQNRIFVFTPKGDVIDLPEDATPVDFAYHVHTDIGHKCIGALVNDQIASLESKLKSGDVCEITIDKHRKAPNPRWLDFVKTNLAKTKIKEGIKKKNGIFQWMPNIKK